MDFRTQIVGDDIPQSSPICKLAPSDTQIQVVSLLSGLINFDDTKRKFLPMDTREFFPVIMVQ